MRTNSYLKPALWVAVFFVIGLFAGQVYEYFLPTLKQKFYVKTALYETPDQQLIKAFSESKKVALGWSDLLPEGEKEAIESYQEPTEEEFIRQITEAIEAASNRSYQPPLLSVDIVEQLVGRAVSISGFIVPFGVSEDKRITSYFLVPYYGACIHYPPPPPNQMILVELTDGFSSLDLEQAYTVSGFLEKGLFEDPLGTSAYVLKAVSIKAYYGQPDDARRH